MGEVERCFGCDLMLDEDPTRPRRPRGVWHFDGKTIQDFKGTYEEYTASLV